MLSGDAKHLWFISPWSLLFFKFKLSEIWIINYLHDHFYHKCFNKDILTAYLNKTTKGMWVSLKKIEKWLQLYFLTKYNLSKMPLNMILPQNIKNRLCFLWYQVLKILARGSFFGYLKVFRKSSCASVKIVLNQLKFYKSYLFIIFQTCKIFRA